MEDIMAEKDYVKTVYVDGSEPDVDAVHLNNTEDGLDGLYHPEFDDSGTVEGITSFPTFLSTVVKRMNPIAFYKNFKAGMKYVLHTGSLINNGLCTETGKYAADATQLNPNIENTLAWQVAKVNSDLAPQLIGSTTSADGTISSANFSKYRFLIVRIGAGGWSRTEFFINQSYIGAFYALDNTADQKIRLDYDGTKIKLSGYSGGSFNICEAYGFVLK